MQAAKIRAAPTSKRRLETSASPFHGARARKRGSALLLAAAAPFASGAASASAPDSSTRAELAGGWPNALQLPESARHRPAVPSLLRARHYVNLSAGAEALPLLSSGPLTSAGAPPPLFIRLTSTACEQQQLAQVTLAELADASLLVDLALGEAPVVIWDAGSRKGRRRRRKGEGEAEDAEEDDDACCPRALWYGAEFARWALHTLWFGGEEGRQPAATAPARAYLRGYNVRADFERHLKTASPSLIRRLRYFSRFVPEERRLAAIGGGGGVSGQLDTGPFALRLYGCYKGTEHDGDSAYCVARVREAAAGAGDSEPWQRRQDGGGGDGEKGARTAVLEAGWRVFAGGVGHEEMGGLLKKLNEGP